MKKNKKKLGIGGIILLVVLYVLLMKVGLITPQEMAEEDVVYETAMLQSTADPVVTKTPEATAEPVMTEEPTVTKTPEVTKEPEMTKEPAATKVPEITAEPAATNAPKRTPEPEEEITELTDFGFRNKKLRDNHFEKHGIEMGFATVEDYIEAANKVISNPEALHKLEAEDNDHVYFVEETNEFVVLSQDGYIRTYYIANGGIDYFNRQ